MEIDHVRMSFSLATPNNQYQGVKNSTWSLIIPTSRELNLISRKMI